MDAKKTSELCLMLNALNVATLPAVQSLRKTADDIRAIADMAEALAALSRQLLTDLGQAPLPPARPELRVVTPPRDDAG